MKLLVATRSDGKINKITETTLPLIEKYAKDCGADFKILDQEPPIWTTESPPRPHYRIMAFKELFEDYNRILSIDCDLIVNKNCPNIFEEVPYDCVGSIYEDVGNAAVHRKEQIQLAQAQFGDVGWKDGYINTGFAVFSDIHKNIFEPINGQYYMGFGIDDIHLCYLIRKYGHKVHELPYKWNHMTMFSEGWNGHANRFDSYILHYAGEGVFDRRFANRAQQIKNDVNVIYGDKK